MIPMSYDDETGTLTIGERKGAFPGMLKERVFNVIKISSGSPAAYSRDAKGHEVKYDGSPIKIRL